VEKKKESFPEFFTVMNANLSTQVAGKPE